MDKKKTIDPFTHHILHKIDYKVYNSFSSEQLSAVCEAIRATAQKKKHRIDIRGRINLIFISFYFVFLMGRDRRSSTEAVEEERREKVSLLGNLIFFIMLFSAFILLSIVILYLLKSVAGIDLFPGKHMGGIFGL